MPRKVLQLDGGFNFRDLGGYPSAQQTTVKWHRLMRAAHLANLTATDCQQLEDLGFKLVVDLRSTAEAQQFSDQLGPQMRRIHLPVFDNDETESAASTAQIQRLFARDPLGGYHRMLRVYRRLVTSPQAQQAYHELFALLLATQGKTGVIFHCSAGKDRTGMAAMLILRALGVPPQRVMADYLLTNSASTAHIAQRVAAVAPGPRQQNFQQSVRDLASVQLDYYQQAMGLIDYEYGGMTAYLRDTLKLTATDEQKLRHWYLA